MRLLRSVREWTLGAKLAATFFVLVAGVAALVSVSVVTQARLALDGELRKRGMSVVENLARLSVDLVLQDDLWGLYKVVRDIASGSGEHENVVVYAAVLDPAGRVLAHSDPARYPMGEPIPADRQDGSGETIHDLLVPIVLDHQRIGAARVGITTRYLESTITKMARAVVLVSVVLGALGVGLALVISRRMTRPLRRLSQAVDRIAEGHLAEPVAVTTTEKDEIGRLADRFNLMATTLRENVSEIRETKRYLENLLESANDFIYTLDLDGRFTYVNHHFLELGFGKVDLVGKPFQALGVCPPAAPAGQPSRRDVFELQVGGADGRRRTLVVTESPLLDNERRVIGALGIAKDVSEHKELEARLMRTQQMASVGELAGALAHEIRNPLGSLFAAAKMLGADSPQAAGYDHGALIRVITGEARRLDGILGDFLRFARPRPPRRLPHHLNELVGEVVDSLRLDRVAEGKTFRMALEPALPAVPVDADQIKQVLWNIVRNALEASPPSGELGIRTDMANGRVVVEVSDHGAGIPADTRARLFEPFQTTKPGGSGLGLAIAHRIVAAHGGSIDVSSRSGAGTAVLIQLPHAP